MLLLRDGAGRPGDSARTTQRVPVTTQAPFTEGGATSPQEKIEILKIVTWPGLVVWLVWYLREELKRAAARIIEFGLTGAKFAPRALPAPVSALPGNLRATGQQGGSAQQFIASIKAQVSEDQLTEGVQNIRNELTAKVGSDLKEQCEALLYGAAALHIQLSHERNYGAIFGSQLQAMVQMNTDLGVSPNDVKDIYEAAKAASPTAYRSFAFEQWISFLTGASLCTTARNGNYVLTKYGRGFLKYILDRHLPAIKPL